MAVIRIRFLPGHALYRFGQSSCAQLRAQMIGKSQAQGDDRKGRERPATRRKYRASGDMQIVHAMHATHWVDDTLLRIVGHARSAQMMGRGVNLGGSAVILAQPRSGLVDSAACAGKLSTEQRCRSPIGIAI